ncbi:MAG: deoxyribodipyrimidine photo-lyase [Anaerolineae bacterium]|nr:deoxyribodipyrimidine photo-lyase [Anaerolineae bacterium]
MNTAIWWIRRDLRLSDNQALTQALTCADQIVPVFIFDPALLRSPYVAPKRLAFVLEGLRWLDADLQARGSRLIIRRGEPKQELSRLLAQSGSNIIFAEADFSPYARCRDQNITATLPLLLQGGLTVCHPNVVLKANGTPYTMFTPFSRAWRALPLPQAADLLPAPERILTPSHLPGEAIPVDPPLSLKVPFPAGEAEAQRRLARFAGQRLANYVEQRNRLDFDGTSQLSPYLRFGMLSTRQAVVAAREAIDMAVSVQERKAIETWLNELIWREFYISILYHFPQVRRRSFRPEYDRIPWLNDETDFAAWQEGRTGYPVVDAAMRQLVQTGWIHNRARMIVASFLVKDLLIDWRWGERWFMQHLVDGDPAANNGGWQWSASTGTDAAPYFRIFNPVLQGQKFDPEGEFVRRWVPELAEVPQKFIHTPWEMPLAVQQEIGCVIGQDYPAPLVDHALARKRVLAAYAQANAGAVLNSSLIPAG